MSGNVVACHADTWSAATRQKGSAMWVHHRVSRRTAVSWQVHPLLWGLVLLVAGMYLAAVASRLFVALLPILILVGWIWWTVWLTKRNRQAIREERMAMAELPAEQMPERINPPDDPPPYTSGWRPPTGPGPWDSQL